MKTILKLLFVELSILLLCVSCFKDETFSKANNATSNFALPSITPEDFEESVVLENLTKTEETGYKNSYISLSNTWLTIDKTTLLENSAIDIKDGESRIIIPNMEYDEWLASDLKNKIYVNGTILLEDFNAKLLAYYNYGIAIRIIDNFFQPVLLQTGDQSEGVSVSTIYTGDDVPLGSQVEKLYLKRGYQVIVAASEDGTVSSRCFIAVDKDIEITLDSTLKGKIKFLRSLAIDYVTKRGISSKNYPNFTPPFTLGWYYSWGSTDTISDIDPFTDFLPMFWSRPSDTAIDRVIEMQAPIVCFLNEPDNDDQSNVSVENALISYKAIHSMGVRLVTPSCCEITNFSSYSGDANKWLMDFMAGVEEQGLRYDGIGMHWYSWCQKNYTDTTAGTTAVTKLKSALSSCYNTYGKPIFLTEFNITGSGASTTSQQDTFFCAANAAMEELEYVERYAAFPPGSTIYWFMEQQDDGSYELNEYGDNYCNYSQSTPSLVLADDSRASTSEITVIDN